MYALSVLMHFFNEKISVDIMSFLNFAAITGFCQF